MQCVLTAFSDAVSPDRVAVSVRNPQGRRCLVVQPRPRAPQILCVEVASGHRRLCDRAPVEFEPAYGQLIDGHRYYPTVLPWRVFSPEPLPQEPPDWLRETLFFVWGDRRRVAVVYTPGDSTVATFPTSREALEYAHTIGSDVLYVCTRHAALEFAEWERQVGVLERRRLLPVVCHPDDFVRVTMAGQWYHQPLFNPRRSDMYSERRLREVCTALAQHRAQWIGEQNILALMFSISRVTRLPLHEVSTPHQTALADALIERVWMDNPLELAPLERSRSDAEHDVSKFAGASVLSADCRLHYGRICVPDLSSLYPNVVREYMSESHPLYAKLFAMMIAERAATKNPVHALALKVTTNSVFGSRKFGWYPDRALAEAITALGRAVQQESLAALAAELSQQVSLLGGDTDALALAVDTATPVARLIAVLNGQRQFALYKEQVDTFSAMFFVNNKSWAGLTMAGAIVTRGLMNNRSKTPLFVRQSHTDWIERVLHERDFATSSSVQREWITSREQWLRAQRWSAIELACWAKPTRDHPDSDRAVIHLKGHADPVPLIDYLTPGHDWCPVDMDYLLRVYFLDELRRHVALLERGPAFR